MAPELWDRNHEAFGNYEGTNADIWSTGVILHLLSTMSYPFRVWNNGVGYTNDPKY